MVPERLLMEAKLPPCMIEVTWIPFFGISTAVPGTRLAMVGAKHRERR